MNKKFLSLDKQFDEEGNLAVVLQIDTELIRGGILTSLKPSELKILLALASHMDDNGECFPSQRHLAEISGVAFSTVTLTVNSLLDVRITDLPIVTRRKEGTGARQKSVYSFNIDTENPAIEVKRESPATYQTTFCSLYAETYGVPYKVNGARDMNSIKSMMKVYTDIEMEAIIPTVVKEYSKRWSNVKFPAPTIGAMSSFIAGQALQIFNDRAKTASKWDDCENDEQSLDL